MSTNGNHRQTVSALEIDIDAELAKLQKRLEGLPKDVCSRALVNALNMAGRKVRAQMVKDAKGEYALKDKKILNSTNKAEGAPQFSAARGNFAETGPTLEAKIYAHGPVRDIMDYMFTPNSATSGAAAKVLNSSSLKEVLKNGVKAFQTRFDSGLVAIVARVPGQTYTAKGKKSREKKLVMRGHSPKADMTRIKKLLSPSVPHMLNKEKVRGQAKNLFYDKLQAAIEKQVEKTLKKYGRDSI